MDKELSDFNSLFDLVPSINIAFISNNCNSLVQNIDTLISTMDGTLTNIDIKSLKDDKKLLYKKNFEYGILCDILDLIDDKKQLIDLIHNSIGNSAYIIVLEKKDKNLQEIFDLLDRSGFGALSNIDIFADYNLVMGKKLHMWGMD